MDGAERARSPDERRLGWREWLALPALGIPLLKAKLDTGARTSALHAVDIEPFDRGGAPWVAFTTHPVQRSRVGSLRVEAPLVDRRIVRSSSGATASRCTIGTPILCAGLCWEIEVTLAARDRMGFRMLLGRSALRGFVVDPAASFLAGSPALVGRVGDEAP